MVDLIEMYVHWFAGRSKSQIAESLGVDRGTLRKYLAPAEAAGIVPGGPPAMTEADWRERIAQWFPSLMDTRLRQVSFPVIGEHRDYIVAQLAAGVSQATVHQRLHDEHGLEASVASFRRYVAAMLPEELRWGQVTVARPPVPGGEEGQVDYGYLGMWTDPVSGRRRRVDAFVMVLSCSRHMFVRPVLRMDQRAWTEAHVAAFEFFGGAPRRLVPDNLKTGVDKPDLYDPKINRSYAELAAHYGTLIDPARSRKPKDKPRVERQMPYIRDSWWRGREFTTMEAMRSAALVWCRDVAGARSHRGLDGAAPAEVFAAFEAPELAPLPTASFVLAGWSTPKVGPDAHVKVGRTLYSVPWRLIGQTLDAREAGLTVQFFFRGDLVKTHIARERGKATDLADLPEEKVAFYLKTPTWCRTTAAEVGPGCTEVIAALAADGVMFRLRQAQGILGLRDRHSPERLEAACRKALTAGDPSYRTIKGILALGVEDEAPPGAGDGGAPAFLHGPARLFADVVPLAVSEPAAVTAASRLVVPGSEPDADPAQGGTSVVVDLATWTPAASTGTEDGR